MTEAGFPWPWRGENRRLSLLDLRAPAAIDVLPITRKSPWDPPANQRAPLFAMKLRTNCRFVS